MLLAGIFCLLLFYGLYLTGEILIPILIAFLLKLVLQPAMETLVAFHLPRLATALSWVFAASNIGTLAAATPLAWIAATVGWRQGFLGLAAALRGARGCGAWRCTVFVINCTPRVGAPVCWDAERRRSQQPGARTAGARLSGMRGRRRTSGARPIGRGPVPIKAPYRLRPARDKGKVGGEGGGEGRLQAPGRVKGGGGVGPRQQRPGRGSGGRGGRGVGRRAGGRVGGGFAASVGLGGRRQALRGAGWAAGDRPRRGGGERTTMCAVQWHGRQTTAQCRRFGGGRAPGQRGRRIGEIQAADPSRRGTREGLRAGLKSRRQGAAADMVPASHVRIS